MVESEAKKSPVEALEEKRRLLRSVLLRSKRYWSVLAASVVLAALGAWVAPKILKPRYESEVILTLRQGMESQALVGLREWEESSWNGKLRDFLFSGPNLRELVERERLDLDSVAELGMPRIVERLRRRVRFSAGGETTFVIGYTHDDPEVAQRATRRLGEQLIAHVRAHFAERAASTRKFLEAEESRLGEEVRSAEAKYAVFVSQHPEFVPERSPDGRARPAVAHEAASPSTGRAGQGSTAALQRQAARLRRRLEQLRSPAQPEHPTPTPSPEAELTPESRASIGAATREVQRATDEYNALKSKYTARHPDVVRAQAQLAALQAQLQRVKATAVTTEPTLPQSARAEVLAPPDPNEEESLTRQLQQVEAALQRSVNTSTNRTAEMAPGDDDGARTIVGLETQWAEVSRGRDVLSEQHALIQRRLFTATVLDKAQSAGGGTELVVAEPAYLPKLPSAWGPRRTAAGAAALLLLLGSALMLGLGFLDQRILSEWDLSHLDLAPIALVIPPMDPDTD